MRRFWVGVASRDHVLSGVEGGFCQLCHGRASPIRRLNPGDGIAYYSPKTSMAAGAALQAFTAVGFVMDSSPYEADMGGGFRPTRRDVRFMPIAREAPIKPLLNQLDFTSRQPSSWGQILRRGVFEVSQKDFESITKAMGVSLDIDSHSN